VTRIFVGQINHSPNTYEHIKYLGDDDRSEDHL